MTHFYEDVLVVHNLALCLRLQYEALFFYIKNEAASERSYVRRLGRKSGKMRLAANIKLLSFRVLGSYQNYEPTFGTTWIRIHVQTHVIQICGMQSLMSV